MTNVTELKTSYNGHPDWTHWNVSLWLHNDEEWYVPFNVVAELCARGRITVGTGAEELKEILPSFTPDGAELTKEIIEYYLHDAMIEIMYRELKAAGKAE